jgi:hypothetical protein
MMNSTPPPHTPQHLIQRPGVIHPRVRPRVHACHLYCVQCPDELSPEEVDEDEVDGWGGVGVPADVDIGRTGGNEVGDAISGEGFVRGVQGVIADVGAGLLMR